MIEERKKIRKREKRVKEKMEGKRWDDKEVM